MSATTLRTKVDDFLAQQRIAVAGVSRDTSQHPVGNLIYYGLRDTGHEVFAVNPHLQTFGGAPCYPDLRAIPGGVDGEVIITRPETAKALVHDCVEAGIRRVWMHESFARSQTSVSQAAVDFCAAHGIQVIAGGCPMMYGEGADLGHRCMCWLLGRTGGLPR